MTTKEQTASGGPTACERCAGINTELLAACKEALCWIGQEGTPEENGCKCDTRSQARLQLLHALAKAEGK